MFEFISYLSYNSVFYILIWSFINALPMWYTIYTNKRSAPDSNRDQKFKPWVRKDHHRWSYLLAPVTHFFFIPRLIICWLTLFLGILLIFIIDLGQDKTKPIKPTRRWILDNCAAFLSRVNSFTTGLIWVDQRRVHVDYSYYLGKDYTYRYDRAGVYVFNHLNCFDPVHQLYLKGTALSFIAKKEILNFPFLGQVLRPYDTVLVGRETKDSPEERKNSIRMLEER